MPRHATSRAAKHAKSAVFMQLLHFIVGLMRVGHGMLKHFSIGGQGSPQRVAFPKAKKNTRTKNTNIECWIEVEFIIFQMNLQVSQKNT